MLDDTTRLEFAAHGSALLALLRDCLLVRCRAAAPAGRPLTVLIDTGIAPSAIDRQLAQRPGLRRGTFAAGDDALSGGILASPRRYAHSLCRHLICAIGRSAAILFSAATCRRTSI